MDGSSFLALVYNIALLLAMALVFDVVTTGMRPTVPWLYQVLLGCVLGAIATAVMFTPWVYTPDIIFDTRSILLSIAGLFFGVVPGLVAMLVTALVRAMLGGAVVTGISVIVITGGLGILWRLLRSGPLTEIRARELYFFGLVVHTVMLAIFLVGFPPDQVGDIMRAVAVPVIVLYPVGTMLLGALMANRLRREELDTRLIASEARLRTIIDNLPVPVALKEAGPAEGRGAPPRLPRLPGRRRPSSPHPRRRLTYFNQQFIDTFGYTLADLLTTDDWWERCFPDAAYRARMRAAMEQACRAASESGGVARLDDLHVQAADGTTRVVDVQVVDLGDFDLVVFQDWTALHQAQEKLAASAQQYRLLFAHNPHPMWVFDMETLRFLAVNDAAVAHYGYSEEQFLAMTIRDIRPPEDIPRLEQNLAQRHTRSNMGVWRHRKADGTLIDVEVSADSIVFNGRDARLILARDVTESRRAQAQLREQAALLQAAHDAIIVRDLDHHVRFWNRRAEELYGYRADEVIGRFSVELLYRDPAPYYAAFHELMAHGEWQGELPQVTRDGRDLIVDARWTLLRDETGAPEAVLAINTDITERKKLEAQLLRSQRLESIGTLAGGIAHDLNNVLSPILLAVGLLKRRQHLPDQTRLLNNIEESAQRAATLVRQVLTFARGSTGPRSPMKVTTVIDEVLRFCRDTFPRQIRIVDEIAADLAPIRGDATQIHQLLLNLCVNARDAMPEGGTLTLRAQNTTADTGLLRLHPQLAPGPYVLLSVEDTGVGIPPELHERIFDPFFTTKEVGQGTGLGLPTAQAVVKGHGGLLTFYSEPGQGTVFRVYLPALRAAGQVPESAEAPQADPAAPRGHGETILVVDDEESVSAVTQELLEGYGYRVVTAANGHDALAQLAATEAAGTPIALVLTDMMMPEMDGRALIRELAQRYPHLPIIAASGIGGNGAALAGQEHTAHVRFLAKPYRMEALLALLDELLHR